MITITVEPTKQADPRGTLSALRAHVTMAENDGKKAKARELKKRIKQLLADHPELAEAKPRPKAEGTGDPRRTLAALRATRQRHLNAGDNAKAKEVEKRIKAFIAEHPSVDAPKPKPKSETKDDDGEVDRAAVLEVQERHKETLNAEVDRILRRSKERRAKKAA